MRHNSPFFIFTTLTFLILLLSTMPFVYATFEYISNNGFESGTPNQHPPLWTILNGDAMIYSGASHSGSYSLLCSSTYMFSQTLNYTIPTDTIISFTFWIKTDQASQNLVVWMLYTDGTNSSFVSNVFWNYFVEKTVTNITTGKVLYEISFAYVSGGVSNTAYDDISIISSENPFTTNSPLVYVHTFVPTIIQEGQLSIYPKIYSVILNQSVNYIYNQRIYNSTYSNTTIYPVNGTFYILTSGIYTDFSYWVQAVNNNNFTFTQVLTGVIINGNFSFTISPRTGGTNQYIIHELLEIVTIIDNPFPIHTEQYRMIYERQPIPYNPNFPAGNGLDLTLWLVLFLIILCPIMILGFIFGKSGLLVGMVYSIGIGVATHLLDPWFIIVIVIALIAVLYDMFRGR